MKKKKTALLVLVFLILSLFSVGCASARTIPEASKSEIGTVLGTTGYEAAVAQYPDADVVTFEMVPDMVQSLILGKVDYIVTSYSTIYAYERNTGKVKLYGDPLNKDAAYFAVAKGNETLQKKIDSVISKYKTDGTLEEIKSHWFTDGDYTVPEIPEAENGPELRIATSSDREPMDFYINGTIQGFDAELIRRIAYELGMKPVFQDMKFSGTVAALASGKVDVIAANLAYTEERAQQALFTQAYMDNPQYLAVSVPTQGKSFGAAFSEMFYKTFVKEARWKMILSGIGITLLISFSAAAIGSLAGFGLSLQLRAKKKAVRFPVHLLTEIVTGVPVLVLLLILYYVVFGSVSIPAVAVSIICFSISFAVTVMNILNTGFAGVDPGQLEAATALGYTRRQVFLRFEFRQAARQMLPVYKSSFVTMFKLTSIVGYIAVADLTKAGDVIRSLTFDAFFPLIATAVIYFAASKGISLLIDRITVRLTPPRSEEARKARLEFLKN